MKNQILILNAKIKIKDCKNLMKEKLRIIKIKIEIKKLIKK